MNQEAPMAEIKLVYALCIAVIIALAAAGFMLTQTTALASEQGEPKAAQAIVSGTDYGQPSGNCGKACWIGPDGSPGTFESSGGKMGVLGPGGKCHTPQEFSVMEC